MKQVNSIMNFLYLLINNSNHEKNELPVSSLILKNNEIISYSINKTEKYNNFLMHSEIISINKACKKLKTKYLDDCEIFISLEPCMMCLHAINLSRIKKIIFGSYNQVDNPVENYIYYMNSIRKNFSFKDNCFGGFLDDKFSIILKDFFKKNRNKV
jgi:tRNA(adenine34) deaminase